MLDRQNELVAIANESTRKKELELQSSSAFVNEELKKVEVVNEDDCWSLYIYAMKSPITREKYQRRLDKFFDFVGIKGLSVKDKNVIFLRNARENPQWAFNSIVKFLQFQNQRVNNKEITGAAVRNYVKSIKLFCEMADIPIAWKK